MLFNKNTESVCGGFKKCPILTLESHLGHTFSECSIIELYNRIVSLFMFYYRNDNEHCSLKIFFYTVRFILKNDFDLTPDISFPVQTRLHDVEQT